jgi:hypothetical protein
MSAGAFQCSLLLRDDDTQTANPIRRLCFFFFFFFLILDVVVVAVVALYRAQYKTLTEARTRRRHRQANKRGGSDRVGRC